MKGRALWGMILSMQLLALLTSTALSRGGSENTPEQTAEASKVMARSDSLFKNQTEQRLILVTGDIVVITGAPGEPKDIQILPSDPAKRGRPFRTFTTPDGTYVIPGDVDLNRLDIELFNVDHLLSEGYHNMKSLPLIIQTKNSGNLGFEENMWSSFLTQRAFTEQIPMAGIEDSIHALLERPDVEKIWLDRKVRVGLSESVPLIGAPDLWESEYDGTGIEIAILDTGIDETHPGLDDLDDDPATVDPKVVREIDFTDDYSTVDLHGHGTHVAGIAAGTGAESLTRRYTREYLENQWISDGAAMAWHADDASWSYTLPFDFPFYETYYRTIYISSNGLITFTGPDSSFFNSLYYLAGKLAIAPAWDDWVTDEPYNIYIWEPDPEHVIIRWHVRWIGSSTVANFEAILGVDGVIQFNYGDNDGAVSATVGISNGADSMTAEALTNLDRINTIVFTPSVATCKGVAPGSSLWNVKVLNRYGSGYWSWIISGVEFAAYGPDGEADTGDEADIISMSLGAWNGDGTDPLSIAVDNAVDAGVVVVVAAGNSGPEMFTTETPGVARKAITVGASTKADDVISWSSRGPTIDYRLKPDVVAPGLDITSSVPYSLSGVYYQTGSGTSMSTPHVAGAAALILQTNPLWSPVMVKSALMGNAEVLANAHLWEQGAGRVNVPKAAGATLLALDPSLSFRMLELEDSTNATLTIMNLGDTPATAAVSTHTIVDGVETGYVSVNATTLTIPELGNASVLVSVGPLDDQAPEGWYEGWVILTYDQGAIRVPYVFCALSTITVSVFDVDDVTPVSAGVALTTYPSISLVDLIWIDPWSHWPSVTMAVRSGSYSLQAQSAGISNGAWLRDWSRMFMIQKALLVPKLSNVHVRLTLAEAFVSEIPTVDTSGENLTTHCYTQYFSGDPYFEPFVGKTMMRWSMGSGWFGFDVNASKLTFYSSEYTPSDKLSEALGHYASDALLSEVYLLNWKYWNLPRVPSVMTLSYSDLAEYSFYYDMSETYPENGLNIMNAFWFTWEYLGGGQGWGWDVHQVLAGINATFYLAPENATYFGTYMTTHEGWPDYVYGPLQEWNVGRHFPYPQIPPEKGETGSKTLGKFQFGPYAPDLSLSITPAAGFYLIHLTGAIWADLTWPYWQWDSLSPYPPIRVPVYHLYIDDVLVASEHLGRPDGTWYGGLRWDDVDESWSVTGEKGLLRIDMQGLATISEWTVYTIEFDLASAAYVPPLFCNMLMPLSYSPGEELTIQFDAAPSMSDLSLEYSFSNGATWNAAQTMSQSYMIPCEDADALAIRINATDIFGDSLTYISSPAALCENVSLSEPRQVPGRPGETIEILGNLTTIEGEGLKDLAVALLSSKALYTSPTEDGTFVFSLPIASGIRSYLVASPTVGLFEASSARSRTTTVEVSPETLNLKSQGQWITAYIQFPIEFNPKNIDATAILLNVTIQSVLDPKYEFVTNSSGYLVDHNEDGILERMVKFDRAEVATWIIDDLGIKYGDVALTIIGQLFDGTPFEGSDVIRLLFPGDADDDGDVDWNDLVIFAGCYGLTIEDAGYTPLADFNNDGYINYLDLVIIAGNYGKTAV